MAPPFGAKRKLKAYEALALGAIDGATFGLADDAVKLVNRRAGEDLTALARQAQDEHAFAYSGGALAGGVAMPLGPIFGAARGLRLARRMAKGQTLKTQSGVQRKIEDAAAGYDKGWDGGGSRQYTAKLPSGSHVLVTVTEEGGLNHPSIAWYLTDKVGRVASPSASAGDKVRTGREAMAAVTDVLKQDAKAYRPSGYSYSPTSTSRKKLYMGAMRREGRDMPYEQAGPYGLVFAPKLSDDLAEGLLSTAPLGGLWAAAQYGDFG